MLPIANSATEKNAANGAVARTVDHATNSAHQVIDKAAGVAHPAVDHIEAGAHQTVDKIAGAASQAADKIDVQYGKLKGAQLRFTENCCSHARNNPIASLAIALTAGALLFWGFSQCRSRVCRRSERLVD